MKRYNKCDFEYVDDLSKGTSAAFIGKNKITGKKGVYKDNNCMPGFTNDDIREKLASDIFNLLDIPCAQIDLVYDEQLNQNACFSNYVIEDHEILVEPNTYNYMNKNKNLVKNVVDNYLLGIKDISNDKNFVKAARKNMCEYMYMSCIIDSYDIKNDNLPVVQNQKNGRNRICPWFDFGVAFKEDSYQRKEPFNELSSEEVLKIMFDGYFVEISNISNIVAKRLSAKKIDELFSQDYVKEAFTDEEVEKLKKRLEDQVEKSNKLRHKVLSKKNIKYTNLDTEENNNIFNKIKQKLIGIKNIIIGRKVLTSSDEALENEKEIKYDENRYKTDFENECKKLTSDINEVANKSDLESESIKNRDKENIEL